MEFQSKGPRYTWDANFPKPKGEKNMGTWIMAVYTPEQQAELNIDEYGVPIKKFNIFLPQLIASFDELFKCN